MKILPNNPLNGNGLLLLTRVGHSIRLKWVNTHLSCEERIGSVVVCLTRDRGVAGSGRNGGAALYPRAILFILGLVLVQPRKTCIPT